MKGSSVSDAPSFALSKATLWHRQLAINFQITNLTVPVLKRPGVANFSTTNDH
jgi:hypothetical protein